MDNTVSIACPACSSSFSVPWTGGPVACNDGTGFAETGFTTHCFKCSLNIDHDTLATAKFVRDLIACRDIENIVLAWECISLPACSCAHYLPLSAVAHLLMVMGRFTSRTPRRSLLKSSKHLVILMQTWENSSHGQWRRLLAELTMILSLRSESHSQWARHSNFEHKSISLLIRVANLLRPYRQSSPFSTDLVYKVSCPIFARECFVANQHFTGRSPGWIRCPLERERLFRGQFPAARRQHLACWRCQSLSTVHQACALASHAEGLSHICGRHRLAHSPARIWV